MSAIEINVAKTHDNSPRKEQILHMFHLFSENKLSSIVAQFSEQVLVEVVGESEFDNREDLLGFLEVVSLLDIEAFHLSSFIIHDRDASVNGVIVTKETSFDFCIVTQFTSATQDARIETMKIYVIELKI